MGYHIRRRESVEEAVRRIAVEEIAGAIDDVRLRQPTVHEAVHELRKRCKKIRGLLRLVRPRLGEVYAGENAFYRDLSRDFSFVRDAQASLEALTRLIAHFADQVQLQDFQQLHAYLMTAREEVAGSEHQLVEQLDQVVAPLEQARDRVARWPIGDDGFETVAPGLMKTYRRARRAMNLAYRHPSMHNFHQWRKRVKYHWHHAMLLQRSCPKLIKPHCRLAEQLGELLGQDHDYAGLRERLTDLQGSANLELEKQRFIALIDRRQAELRVEMERLGRFLQGETPRQLAARWRAYWETSRQL
jgi:hypothetical protein